MTLTGVPCRSVYLLLFSAALFAPGVLASQDSCSAWSYGDQESWSQDECSGNLQSPVDIQTGSVSFHPNFSPLAIDTASAVLSTKVSNNGKHIVIRGDGSAVLGFLSGGPLFCDSALYGIVEARFHFGIVVDGAVMSGSDHMVDGQSFAAELQFIAYNTMYPNYDVALQQPNGIAIVSVLFEQKPSGTNVDLNMFLDMVASEVKYNGNDISLDGINLRRLLPESIAEYYTYNGSFTWPRCTHPVTWIVMSNTMPISAEQLASLQSVYTTARGQAPAQPMAGNTRQVQDLNGRTVVSSDPGTQFTGGIAMDCSHEGEQIPLGCTSQFSTPDSGDTRSSRGANDVIFLVDQSGSSRIRRLHRWLKDTEFAMKLNSALGDSGFTGNQFGLVGFGQDLGGHATTIPVGAGGQLLGSAADLQRGFSSLISRGSREDGYAAIQLALRGYDLRPTAHCIILLMTDEGRDELAPGLDKATILAGLQRRQCTLHAVVHEHFRSGMRVGCRPRHRGHRRAFGVDSTQHALLKHAGGEFEVAPWMGYARPRSAHTNTHGAYVQLAWSSGGSVFDIIQLANAGTSERNNLANSLSNMLTQLRLRDFQRFNCQRCTCMFDSSVECRRCDEDFPPQVVVTASPPTVFLGEAGMLECIATGHPAPTVEWQTTDGSSRLPAGTTTEGNTLRIASVTQRNCFTCVANAARLGENEATGCVEVQGVIPEPIVSQPSPINAGAGARFTCVSTGYPEAEITWQVESSDCVVDGNMVTCTNLQERTCVTCDATNRLGDGSDTKCVDVFASCSGDVRHNSCRRRFTGDASIPADNVHLVVLFDESRTMVSERNALPAMISDVETALQAAGFGQTIANKYSLMGFAGSSAPQGRSIPVGGGFCGSPSEFGSATSALGVDGRTEDGYSAIEVAIPMISQCDSGPNSQVILMLMTDEDRDVLRGVGNRFTFDSTLQTLQSANARFVAVVKQEYRDIPAQRSAYGLDSSGKAFVVAEGGASYEVSPTGQPVRDSGFGTTERDYVDLARQTGGSFFNVLTVRDENRRPGFVAALAFSLSEQLASERVRPLCQECCCSGGTFTCTNLPRITANDACMAPPASSLSTSVRSDPPLAILDRDLTLYCSGDNENAVVVWSPHPVNAFQTGASLHFAHYTGTASATFLCTQRIDNGQDTASLTLDAALGS